MTDETPPNLYKPPEPPEEQPEPEPEPEQVAPTPARPSHCPPPGPCHALDAALTRASACNTSPAAERMRRRRSIPAHLFGLRVGVDI